MRARRTLLQPPNRRLRRESGVYAVEFALVSIVFFTLLFGVIEFGRLLWIWNAAADATRHGARMAVVCDIDDPSIKQQMRERLPNLAVGNINLQYEPASCTTATCQTVRVSLNGYVHQPIIPFVPMSVTLPPFETALPREYMKSTNNAICD